MTNYIALSIQFLNFLSYQGLTSPISKMAIFKCSFISFFVVMLTPSYRISHALCQASNSAGRNR